MTLVNSGNHHGDHFTIGPPDWGFSKHNCFIELYMGRKRFGVEAVNFENIIPPTPWFG
jgi:hypothetical protein